MGHDCPSPFTNLFLMLSRCEDAGYGKACLVVSLKVLEKICQAATERHFHSFPWHAWSCFLRQWSSLPALQRKYGIFYDLSSYSLYL